MGKPSYLKNKSRGGEVEKVKDFLYYIGDFLICVLILLAMYFLITWKLDETMPLDVENEEVSIASDEGSPLESGIAAIKEAESREDVESSEAQTVASENTESQSAENVENTNENTDGDMAGVEGSNPEDSANEDGYFAITVSAGMTAQDVADGLLKKGIIGDSDFFLQKLDEMGLTSSLLTGHFEFEEGMDYEEVIQVLTTEEEY